jgi:hypothetical protein
MESAFLHQSETRLNVATSVVIGDIARAFCSSNSVACVDDIISFSATLFLLLEKEFQKNCLDLDIRQTSSGETNAILGQ